RDRADRRWRLQPLPGRRRVLVAGHRRPRGPARSRVRGVGHRRLRAWPPRLPDERPADDPRGAGHGVRGRTDHGGQRRGGDLVTPRNAGRTAALAAALLMAGGTLAACGGGDSTVSGVPASESGAPATEDSGRFTEAPAPVSPDSPGYDTPVVGARERGYLAALEEEGVQTGELSESLVAAGNTICRIRSTGGAAGETTTIADAVAGQISAGGYADDDAEVDDLSRLVVDTAAGQLCP